MSSILVLLLGLAGSAHAMAMSGVPARAAVIHRSATAVTAVTHARTTLPLRVSALTTTLDRDEDAAEEEPLITMGGARFDRIDDWNRLYELADPDEHSSEDAHSLYDQEPEDFFYR